MKRADIPRLLKHLQPRRDRRIVLSFPSGGAVGVAACMAFLRMMHPLGIQYDEFHGTSAGAGFAAAMGLGMSFDEMQKFCMISSKMKYFIDFNFSGFGRRILGRGQLKGLIKGDRFEKQLSVIYGNRRFRDCTFDTYIYAEQENEPGIVGFNRQDHPNVFLHEAVRASSSIHVWMHPKVIAGISYLDGGLMEGMPLKQIYRTHRKRFPRKKLTLLMISSLPLQDHRMFGRGNLFKRMKESFYDKNVRRLILGEYEDLSQSRNVEVFLFHPSPMLRGGTFSFRNLERMIMEMEAQFSRQLLEHETGLMMYRRFIDVVRRKLRWN